MTELVAVHDGLLNLILLNGLIHKHVHSHLNAGLLSRCPTDINPIEQSTYTVAASVTDSSNPPFLFSQPHEHTGCVALPLFSLPLFCAFSPSSRSSSLTVVV